jgi:hypothetical protein
LPLQQLGLWATVIVLSATFNNISAYLDGQFFVVEGNRILELTTRHNTLRLFPNQENSILER